MSADNVFLKLRNLVKTKLIEKKLNVEGKKINFISKKDASYDLLARVGFKDTGFTPIDIDIEKVNRIDVNQMIQVSNKDDLEEIELDKQTKFVEKRKSQGKITILSTMCIMALALLLSN